MTENLREHYRPGALKKMVRFERVVEFGATQGEKRVAKEQVRGLSWRFGRSAFFYGLGNARCHQFPNRQL